MQTTSLPLTPSIRRRQRRFLPRKSCRQSGWVSTTSRSIPIMWFAEVGSHFPHQTQTPIILFHCAWHWPISKIEEFPSNPFPIPPPSCTPSFNSDKRFYLPFNRVLGDIPTSNLMAPKFYSTTTLPIPRSAASPSDKFCEER